MRFTAEWRQPPEDQLAQDAFLAEISSSWTPRSGRERLLEWRSQAEHLRVRLFDGLPSLAPAAFAGPPMMLGTLLFALAPVPDDPTLVPGPPPWAYLLMTLGIVSLSVELALSPRRIRPGHFLLRAAVPLATGGLVIAAKLQIVDVRDDALRLIIIGMALGALAVGLSAGGGAKRQALHRRLLGVTAVMFIASAIPNIAWSFSYVRGGEDALALACVGVGLGGALIGHGLARARRDIEA